MLKATFNCWQSLCTAMQEDEQNKTTANLALWLQNFPTVVATASPLAADNPDSPMWDPVHDAAIAFMNTNQNAGSDIASRAAERLRSLLASTQVPTTEKCCMCDSQYKVSNMTKLPCAHYVDNSCLAP